MSNLPLTVVIHLLEKSSSIFNGMRLSKTLLKRLRNFQSALNFPDLDPEKFRKKF